MDYTHIIIRGATENNLKNVSLRLPKHQITIFTGVSGSGKSSLVLDTIAAKSRRELNDTFPTFVQQYLPKYGRPHVESIENLPIAIVIDQKKPAQNSRSTVGTYTDIAALMRLLFSRVGKPFVGYSESFSFNHPEGSCPRCSGLGEIRELDIHKLVDFDKSLNDEDTIHYIAFGKGGWRWIRYAHSGLFDLDKKIKDYTPEELDLFLNSPQIRLKNPPANWPKTAKYEGLIPRMYRSIINSEEGLLHAAVLNPMLRMGTCPDCGGTGRKILEACPDCKGKGSVKAATKLTLNIPAGADNGSYLKKNGYGEIFNSDIIYIADRLSKFSGADFFLLDFLDESSEQINAVISDYKNALNGSGCMTAKPKNVTFGLYSRGVI